MEKPIESTLEINLRNREVRILCPGRFDFIHAGHCQLIQDAKNKFKKVFLIVGIIEYPNSTSLLGTHEKVETFKSMPEIDEICILKHLPTLDDFTNLNIDYLATANPSLYPISDRILVMEKKVNLFTDKIIAKVVRDYDFHVDNLLQDGYSHKCLNISKAQEISILCKRRLKGIKRKLWNGKFSVERYEKALDSARGTLQNTLNNWSEAKETALANWLKKIKLSSIVIKKFFTDIWEAA